MFVVKLPCASQVFLNRVVVETNFYWIVDRQNFLYDKYGYCYQLLNVIAF
jgi:hypothetical protein